VAIEENKILHIGRGCGKATSNEAEYLAAISAVEYGNGAFPWERKYLRGDSRLVVEQSQGKFRVRAKNLKPLAERLIAELSKGEWSVAWIPRDLNYLADAEAGALLP
jgi:ribonuclease HI